MSDRHTSYQSRNGGNRFINRWEREKWDHHGALEPNAETTEHLHSSSPGYKTVR